MHEQCDIREQRVQGHALLVTTILGVGQAMTTGTSSRLLALLSATLRNRSYADSGETLREST